MFRLFLHEVKLTQPANIGSQDVQRTSPSKVLRTSLKDAIWPSRGRPDLTSRGRPNRRPDDVLKWRPGNILIWRSRDVSGRLIREVTRTLLGRPLEDLQNSQTWMSQLCFNFSFRTYSIDQIYLKVFQHSRCIENPVKLLRWTIFCKIS